VSNDGRDRGIVQEEHPPWPSGGNVVCSAILQKCLTAGLLGSQYVGLQAGGSEFYLEEGSEVLLTQSAIVLESLIGKFLVGGGSDDGSD